MLAPRLRGLGAGVPDHLCCIQLQSCTHQRQPPLSTHLLECLIFVAGTGHLGFWQLGTEGTLIMTEHHVVRTALCLSPFLLVQVL